MKMPRKPIDPVQRELERWRKRGNRKPATEWGKLRHQAQVLRRKARKYGCRGKRRSCLELGYRAALMEADASELERRAALISAGIWNPERANRLSTEAA